ncbi:serine/threonine protein kinase ppk15, putative [Entamoeba invadens IP1]|uniref:Serine/threonine protein kinase ppk15, putative n=1 Tax=Entamoeba invadens IP1 TaxID=370355 RepID=A0A0A1U2D3_ENTIV|nr:serine/threonine protein kinase ppk15, putative [Entamoeba invadens IP1]ELP85683.1 serine/threonine protein kinase ppk15, putative [Entamoeba invadens IP1]|eukprot:XP_004185029.1 serine/threonine protein kinase ppk15, putative [Entamoeba invadens IP1]
MSKRGKGFFGRRSVLIRSKDSLLTEPLLLDIDGIVVPPENPPLASEATQKYLGIISMIDPSLDLSSLTKLRAVTLPATPCHNTELDNINYDLILYTDQIIGSENSDHPEDSKIKQSRYKVVAMLGQGSFGQVLKCVDLSNGTFVALKVLRNRSAYFRQGMLEIAILELLNDKFDKDGKGNTLRLIDHFIYHNHICIVTEMLGINIYELMNQNGCRGFGVNVARTFLQQILQTLIVLYKSNIIHCDLKPENVLLVDFTKQIRVIDFGSACFENSTLYTYIQSRHYRAPEVILGLPYSSAIDMWSLGCIAAEFFIGIPLFPGSSEYNQIYKIIRMIGIPPSALLEKGTKTDNFFNKLKGANGKTLYELKTKEQYERDNNVNIESNRDYFDYGSLEDFCMRVPFRVGARDESRKDEIRAAFYDFLGKVLVWDPFLRMRPSQAINHPFITKRPFNGVFVPERNVSPLRTYPTHETPSLEDVILQICPELTSRSELFGPARYYEVYLKAFDKGIILNIQNPNPFALPLMTPPSLLQLNVLAIKEDEIEDVRKLTKSVDITLQGSLTDSPSLDPIVHHDRIDKNQRPESVDNNGIAPISVPKKRNVFGRSDRDSWSKTTEMKLPESDADMATSVVGNPSSHDTNINSKNTIKVNTIEDSETLKSEKGKKVRPPSQLLTVVDLAPVETQ